MPEVIHLDDPASWPESLTNFVANATEGLDAELDLDAANADDIAEVDLDGRYEREFRAAVANSHIACFHATRLLPHEIKGMRASGLAVLSDELRIKKLVEARSHYPRILKAGDVPLLMDNGPLSWESGAVRNGSLCFVTPWTAIIEEGRGLGYVLGRWGGEAIGWTDEAAERAVQVLTALDEQSLPAIVEFKLAPEDFVAWHDMWFVAVGCSLGLRGAWTESRTERTVPPSQIIRIRLPDSPDWPTSLPEYRR